MGVSVKDGVPLALYCSQHTHTHINAHTVLYTNNTSSQTHTGVLHCYSVFTVCVFTEQLLQFDPNTVHIIEEFCPTNVINENVPMMHNLSGQINMMW